MILKVRNTIYFLIIAQKRCERKLDKTITIEVKKVKIILH